MMGFLRQKCEHSINDLVVQRDQTVEPINPDFDRITYYFTCKRCDAPITMAYAKIVGNADTLWKRGAVEVGTA